ncbi:MAG TPA: SdrD B-like domain-containing protein [Tepidisphaeraceae bacterium]|nr:SdrD B-like domain-containing protein [Tepidisphaeraceae bacterium]
MNTKQKKQAMNTATMEALDVRRLMSATVAGWLIADNNANNSWDSSDTRRVGWTAYIDANDNSQLDTGELSAVSDFNGVFRFEGLQPGTYRVRQVLQEGWRQTFPLGRDFNDVTVAAGQTQWAAFGATQAVSNVEGQVFNDADNNGRWDAGENAEANRIVYFDTNNNGLQDLNERWTTTSSNGSFQFTGLPSGQYRIRLTQAHGWSQSFGSDSAIAVVNGTDSVTGLRFAHYQQAEPANYDADRLVSFVQIGGSSTINADRRVGWNIKTAGWAGFVQTYIQPQVDWGIQRIILHNPFGTLQSEGDFRADQAILARESGLNWLLDGFVAAWSPIIAQGVEVVAYVGTPMNDPSFNALNDTDWWERVWDSFDLPLSAGMKIGLDKSLAANPGSRDWALVEAIRNQGSDVYGEPRPPMAAPHWRSSSLFAEDWVWIETRPETNAETYWAANDSQITGDVTRLISRPPTGQTWGTVLQWAPAYIRNILREGHSASLNFLPFVNSTMSMAQLLTAVPTAGRPAAPAGDAGPQPMPWAFGDDDATFNGDDDTIDAILAEDDLAWSFA